MLQKAFETLLTNLCVDTVFGGLISKVRLCSRRPFGDQKYHVELSPPCSVSCATEIHGYEQTKQHLRRGRGFKNPLEASCQQASKGPLREHRRPFWTMDGRRMKQPSQPGPSIFQPKQPKRKPTYPQFLHHFETMGTTVCWYLQGKHHSRLSWVVQNFATIHSMMQPL